MNFQNISAWSIRNPVIPLVFFVAVLLAGIMSFRDMDVVNNPEIDFPAAIVSIIQPGAAPSEIENQITQRVESAVRAVDGVRQISSTASEGSSRTFVEFEIGTDTNSAVAEVKNAVDSVRSSLPDGILEPRINKANAAGGFLGIYAVEAKDMTIEQLSWFIDDAVAKRLLSINGMAEVDRFGGVDREIEVILDLSKMQALGVTASQVNQVLRSDNLDASGGMAEVGGTRQSVRVLGNTETPYELSQRQVRLGNGRTVKLADFSTVRDGFSEQTSISKVRDDEVVNFALERARGASDVTVFEEAERIIAEIEAENPGVNFIQLFNTVKYTKNQYSSSLSAMVEGAVLAVVVVFFFLRDWRATIISAVAIPLSAIPTFWFMDLLGFNLNFLSLLALGLVAGVLVDDAIVEIENIVRHMRMGKSAYQASIDAADEIGLPVVATSFCIVAVFLPVGLMPGISGQFMENFGITVVIAVLMSLAVARAITPMLAAYFLKAKGHGAHGEGPWMDRYMNVLRWTLDRGDMLAARADLPAVEARSSFGVLAVVLAFYALICVVLGSIAAAMSDTGIEAGIPMLATAGVLLAIMFIFWVILRLGAGQRLFYVFSLLFVVIGVLGLGAFALFTAFGAMNDLGVSTTLAEAAATEGSLLYLLISKPIDLLQLTVATGLGVFSVFVVIKLLAVATRMFGQHIGHAWKYLEARFLDHRIWMLGTGYFAFMLTIVLFMQTSFQFEPEIDDENARVEIEMVPGTTIETTDRVAREVANLLYDQPEVELALERVRQGNATIFITLKEDRARTKSEFERELAPELAKIADARVRFQGQQGPGGAGSGRAITIMLAGSDPILLNDTAATLVEEMKGLDSLVAPRISADVNRPEILIRPRPQLMADLGVSTIAVSQAIRIATMGEIEQNAAKFSLSDRQIPIIVKLPESSRRDIKTIETLPVPTASGGSVPLGRIADVSFGAGPTAIQRYNQSRRILIGADLAEGALRGNALEEINQLPALQDLPPGVIRDSIGTAEVEEELQENFKVALVAGVLLVFAVLVLLYKRLMSPLVNMTSLALAPLGGVFLIWIVGQPNSMPVLIGILLLLGIVSKNSILLIDFAIEEMAKGTPKLDAIIDAGHKRAQPIVMTTVAMTAGMVPTAISLAGDGAWRQPMGVVVIGGLIMSTVLTLLIVPAGFSLADGFEQRIGPWMRNKFLTYRPGDDKVGAIDGPEAEAVPAE